MRNHYSHANSSLDSVSKTSSLIKNSMGIISFLFFYRHSRMDGSIPMFLKVVRNLIIEDREAIKMNMATDPMKIEVYISTIHSRTQPRRTGK